MRKVGKSSKKGFTLVELIVVLVILAVLAAMLVPALTGYIKKAREEKEFQAASTVYAAAQALATQDYAVNKTDASGITVDAINGLASVKPTAVYAKVDTNGVVREISIQFESNGSWYNYDTASKAWTAGTQKVTASGAYTETQSGT